MGGVWEVPAPLTLPSAPADEICDYFGVKIAMYFAWLGFYTSAMVYPAVFGSILYTFTESDQVRGVGKWGKSLHLGAGGGGVVHPSLLWAFPVML